MYRTDKLNSFFHQMLWSGPVTVGATLCNAGQTALGGGGKRERMSQGHHLRHISRKTFFLDDFFGTPLILRQKTGTRFSQRQFFCDTFSQDNFFYRQLFSGTFFGQLFSEKVDKFFSGLFIWEIFFPKR